MSETRLTQYYNNATLAKFYDGYRPRFPQKVYDVIMAYHRKSGHAGFDLAVDVGCGTGQGTFPLAKYFKKVLGVDSSEAQISLCPNTHANVSFCVGLAEDMSFLQSGSVDMVTAAVALHWLDRNTFFPEVHRVLKPHGTFAAYSYEYEYFHCDALEDYIKKVRREVLHKHISNTARTKIVFEKYRTVTMPLMEDLRMLDVCSIDVTWSVDEYLAYLQSLSYVSRYKKDNPDHDIIGEIRENVVRLLCDKDTPESELKFKVCWDIFMIESRKPM